MVRATERIELINQVIVENSPCAATWCPSGQPGFHQAGQSPVRRCQRPLVFLLGISFLGFWGCEQAEPIRQYRISTAVPAVLKGNDRMLGAMIPHEQAVWFFKVTGPVDAIESAEKEIRQFIKDVKFTDGSPQIDELPSGWNRDSDKPMRMATLLINTPSKQLELAISQLPKTDDWDEQVALNVNRWRGQLKLADSPSRWAGAEPLELTTATDPPAVWVDITGEMGAGPSMPPFANMGAPPSAAGASSEGSRTPMVADAGGPATSTPGSAGSTDTSAGDNSPGKLKYEAPEGWRAGKMSMMRLAAFDIGPEDQKAELTIIQAGGDLRGNVDRWLGQVRGETPPSEVVDAALSAAERMTVSGYDAQRFYLDNGKPEDPQGQAIDATIVPLEGGMSMFIKATGPAETLAAQRDAIGKFLKSLSIPK